MTYFLIFCAIWYVIGFASWLLEAKEFSEEITINDVCLAFVAGLHGPMIFAWWLETRKNKKKWDAWKNAREEDDERERLTDANS